LGGVKKDMRDREGTVFAPRGVGAKGGKGKGGGGGGARIGLDGLGGRTFFEGQSVVQNVYNSGRSGRYLSVTRKAALGGREGLDGGA